MQKYQERVLALYETEPERITPDGYRREVLALLREPIGDLCISRPKSRLTGASSCRSTTASSPTSGSTRS